MSGGRAMEAVPGLGWGWAVLVLLFAASLLTVSAWLLQLSRSLWRGRRRSAGAPRSQAAPTGLWAAVLRLGRAREGAGSSPAAGPRGLLASLFAFRAFRENWQRAWLRALNDQARQHGVSRPGGAGRRGSCRRSCALAVPAKADRPAGEGGSKKRNGRYSPRPPQPLAESPALPAER